MLLLIDNYDSFVYNLYQLFAELIPCQVVRNDALSVQQVLDLKPAGIVLSPGPGRPEQAGICLELLQRQPQLPVLGVCLGHQSLAQAFGGRVIKAPSLMHGKTSEITHNNAGLFAGLPQPLTVARYHSLVAEADSLPDCLEVTAWSADGLIMGLRHRSLPYSGVQFHPESIATPQGRQLLAQFVSSLPGGAA